MAVIRWEPAREIQSIQQEMNRLFGSFFDGENPERPLQRRWIPAMDLLEEDAAYVLHADLPGLSEKDVKVELDENVLTISGERSSEHGERQAGYRRIERASGSFRRTLTLPEGIDPASIEATVEDGVLTVRIPKPEEPEPRRIAINVGRREPAIEGKAAQAA